MKTILKDLRLFIMLMIFWMVLGGAWNLRQVLSGIVASVLTIFLYNWTLKNSGADRVPWIPFPTVMHFGSILFLEIFKAAFHHLLRIIRGEDCTSVCLLHLTVPDELAFTLVSNAITLTPGTVTLEAETRSILVLTYGEYVNQCPLELIDMIERLQKPFKKVSEC